MTNKEAAEMIRKDMKLHHDSLSGEYRKALSMAISALQAQEAKTQLSEEDTTLKVKKTCITCKHYPPGSKWPCIDCDMRNPADRWEPQELSKNSPKLDKENGDLQPTCNQLATDTISRQTAIDIVVFECGRWTGLAKEISKQIKQLPSAQPEPCEVGAKMSLPECEDVPDTNVGKMDGDALDEAIAYFDKRTDEIKVVTFLQVTSWLKELKRLRTEVCFLKAEKENEPVDLLGDVSCKTCKWRVTTTEKCEECIDGVSDNYEVQEPCEDCVSRQAAIDAALSAFSRGLLASPDIRRLPSVQPEIVRCKDCMYYGIYYRGNESKPVITHLCKLCLDRTMEPDDFCSRAERKTDEPDR